MRLLHTQINSIIVSQAGLQPQLKVAHVADTLKAMRAPWKQTVPILFICFFSFFLFRDYLMNGLVPFPANLLVSYYEPWKSYPAPEYPNGPPNKAMGFDNVRIYFPVKTVAADSLKRREVPLWNPYNFSGTVLLATYQSALFHPLSWLFTLIPLIDAWSVIIVLQPVLAALAMYLLLGTLGFSRSAKFIGSVSFAFSGFFMTWWQESYLFGYSSLFLPLGLAAVEMYLKKPRGVWIALLAVSLGLSVVSGAFQMTFYVYLFTGVWILYRSAGTPNRIKTITFLSSALLVSLLLSAVHLIPNMEAYMLSTRVSTDVKYIFDAYLLPLSQLVTVFAPDYFGNPATYNYFGGGFYHERLMFLGVIPFLFILSQLLQWKTTGTHEKFFRIAFLLTLSLTLSIPTTWLILYYLKLPLLSTMTPSRMMMLVTFTGSVLTAFTTEQYWRSLPKKVLIWTTIIAVVCLIAATAAPIISKYVDDKNTSYYISLRNLAIPTASIMAALTVLWITYLKTSAKRLGFVILTLILLGNIFMFAKKYMYFSERRFVYPASPVFTELNKHGYNRFWTYDNGYIEKNFASQYSVYSPEGYDSIIIRRYAEFLAYANSRGTSLAPDRANALIQSTDHIDDILADQYRKKMLELLGVRYIARKLTPDRNRQTVTADPPELPRVWDDGTYAIHEYGNALPRVHLFTDVRIEPDGNKILKSLYASDTDIRKTVFLEERPSESFRSESTGSAVISSYTANTATVQTETNGTMMLLLSDTYYPGWNAYVDGKLAKLYRANYTLRAVAAPQGTHTIQFRYEPWSWKLGLTGTIAGLIMLGCLVWLSPKRHS